MKKLFTLAATVLVALCANAQVNSTRVELSPLNYDAENSNSETWKFTGTDITLSNDGGKKHSEMSVTVDEYRTVKLIKISKDVTFKVNIPEGHACVRLEWWGRTNSTDYNWSYLHSVTSPSLETPIFLQTGGEKGDGRDIMDNTAIQTTCTYPLSPYEDVVAKGPQVAISDELGWYSEVKFMYDGNNQVGTVLVVYTVPEADMANYKTATDASIVNTLSQLAMPTIVPSKRVELSPLYADAANSDKATWKFKNTGVTLNNASGKSYGSVDAYSDTNFDTCSIAWMKMSKDVEFKLSIPADSAVVRIEFWGVSNSSSMNWAYLHSVKTTSLEQPIFLQTGGAAGDGRDIGVGANDDIKTNCPYPFSPEAKTAEAAPVAVLSDDLGWFDELSFLYDGNNQVGANIVLYMVHADELKDYQGKYDPSIKAELDKPATETPDGIKVVPVVRPFNPNAPIYNLAGQQVDKNYKGFVIQNGKKYILR